MKIYNINKNNKDISVIESEDILINDVNSGLDFAMEVSNMTGINNIIVNKEAVDDVLFDLKNKILGELLQKYINYNIKFAVIGDFSKFKSKALNDFIYEINNGRDFFFVEDIDTAVEKMTSNL
ncbi:DUF4180 domain-containing protein [Anaerofustis stercorihominis]|uniref:DUF4180 domain-containing protein n=1 Tax=Anaerofustis stercorihominis TaxID=214853 RepID=UPI00214D0CC9|nr:DUF4180 domain-containing protein [Anaerofustis stercorihominis]MCR2033147.1 DUF4180 domain-containing protein [Anaerofustis stercorihominis]